MKYMKNTSAIKLLLVLILSLGSQLAISQTFSNSTSQAWDSWNSSNAWATALSRTITVSGLSTSLSSAGTVLQQVNLTLGDATHTGLNLSTYAIRIKSPSGTIINIAASGGFSATSVQNVAIKYRDDALLLTPSSSSQEPFDIGYYRVTTSGSFANVNGENPNGSWTMEIAENTSTEIAFSKIELVFGTAFSYTNITATTSNDACSAPQCMSTETILKATISGYSGNSSNDPNVNTPWPGGCQWNASKDNSGWFYFKANATTAKITISGVSAAIQTLVVNNTNACTAGSQTVPTGGCPRDAVNDTYTSARYTSTAGSANNQQLNLSGLTIGNEYRLIIDGSSGAISSLYIEMTGNVKSCIVVLGVDIVAFDGVVGNRLFWKTSNEINCDYYILERSVNGIDWEVLTKLPGQGTYSGESTYEYDDVFYQKNVLNYYRLTEVDYDGKKNIYHDKIKALDNRDGNQSNQIIRTINYLGQDVDITTPGVLLIQYSDGTVKKIMN